MDFRDIAEIQILFESFQSTDSRIDGIITIVIFNYHPRFVNRECWIKFNFALSGIKPVVLACYLPGEPEPDPLVLGSGLLRARSLQG